MMRAVAFTASCIAVQGLSEVCYLPSGSEHVCENAVPRFTKLGAATLRESPKIRDRNSLPDSHLAWMPESLSAPGEDFPAVFAFSGNESLQTLGSEISQFLDENLPRFGAIVMKGLGVNSPEDMSQLMHATNMKLTDYVGGVTSRPLSAPKVTPASTEGNDVCMESHNDDPYWAEPPSRLVFYMKVPPPQGGQGFLTDARAVLRTLQEEHPEIVEELKARKVQYQHFYPDRNFDGKILVSWQDAYAMGCQGNCTNLTAAAEQVLRDGGYGFEWTKEGLKKWEVTDAIMEHPLTGEESWVNQLTAMHCSVFDNHPAYPELNRRPEERGEPCSLHGAMTYHTTYGDGGEFPAATLHAIRRAQYAHTISFDYEAGDVAFVDNYFAMHGRLSFELPREFYIVMVGGQV